MTVVVVGAGAAGLVAAIFARRAGQPVVVLEKTADGGRKILISGGGRCNILPAAIQPERFVTESPGHLVRHVLRSWPLDQQRAFFEREVGTPLVFEAATRKWFPASHRARDVRDGLVALAHREGVNFRFGCELLDLASTAGQWRATTSGGEITTGAVVLATGGLSVPSTGSDGAGLRIAARLGHAMHETYPALTPLVAEPPVHSGLAGISLNVRLRARDHARHIDAHGGFLFTHRGYSGPSVLDASHVAVRSRLRGGERASLRVQWCDLDRPHWQEIIEGAAGPLVSVVARHVPERLAQMLVASAGIPAGRTVSELRRSERLTLIEHLTAYVLPWTGDEGYKKAEVTGGGVALEQLDVKTLESRIAPGLYMCGEMLDAFGPIGGFNFAWAWASGRLAGLAAGSQAR